ncbi:hypothetical protein QJS04_geneDACA021996 [Acorus gramineus]|uniref:Uncharacterized protein n=2 Tax=Acorus gramineus TaxID=55184 RepID=A0AAV9A0L1_ACOGR|nr:hypothetical protein QJS04_geneDACA021996 [Acorus gramineus]
MPKRENNLDWNRWSSGAWIADEERRRGEESLIFNVIKALCLIHKKPLSKDSFEVVNGPNKRVTFDEEDQENLYKLVQALRDPEIDQSRLFFTRKDVDLDGAGKLRRAEIAQDWESRKIKQLELVVSRLRRTSLRKRSMERVGGGRNMRRREKSSSEMKGVGWKDTNPCLLILVWVFELPRIKLQRESRGIKDQPRKIAGCRPKGQKTYFDISDGEDSCDSTCSLKRKRSEESAMMNDIEPKIKLKKLCKQLLLQLRTVNEGLVNCPRPLKVRLFMWLHSLDKVLTKLEGSGTFVVEGKKVSLSSLKGD